MLLAACGTETVGETAMDTGPMNSPMDTSGGAPPATPPETGLLVDQTLQVNGETRETHLWVPEDPAGAPVVLLLHGYGETHDALFNLDGANTSAYAIWLDVAARENLVVAAPAGLADSGGRPGWNDCRLESTSHEGIDDVAFLVALIDHLTQTFGVDASRVYAIGTSNGGHMALRLAEEVPDRIAAFVANAASNTVNSRCSTSTVPVSAMFVNGTADPLMPYEGGLMVGGRGTVASTEDTVAAWVARNQATSTPQIEAFADLDITDGCTAERFAYAAGDAGAGVELLKVTDGGHTTPSIAFRSNGPILQLLGPQNGDLEMAEEAWAFFADKRRP